MLATPRTRYRRKMSTTAPIASSPRWCQRPSPHLQGPLSELNEDTGSAKGKHQQDSREEDQELERRHGSWRQIPASIAGAAVASLCGMTEAAKLSVASANTNITLSDSLSISRSPVDGRTMRAQR